MAGGGMSWLGTGVNNKIQRMEIKLISAEDTWPIRHRVMWPEKPVEYVVLPKDQEGQHFGLFVDGQLVSTVSLFVEGDSAQFRKFATVQEFQGRGYGTQLLNYLISFARHIEMKRLWGNARTNKIHFYERFGFLPTPQTFQRGGLDYVIIEQFLFDKPL